MSIIIGALDRHRLLNVITGGVPALDWPSWRPHSKLINFKASFHAASIDEYPEQLIFPTSAIFSLSSTSSTGGLAEASSIGKEGYVGVWLLSSPPSFPLAFILQRPGFGILVDAAFIRRQLIASSDTRQMLLKHAAASVRYAHQTCLCYRYHTLEQQVTKIILMTLLRTGQLDIEFTHQEIATILGVRREGISTALEHLQRLGLIDKRRGLIRVLQKNALEAQACECYALLRNDLGYNQLTYRTQGRSL